MKKLIPIVSVLAVTAASIPQTSPVRTAVAADTIKIMCIGDSITDGYSPAYTGSYRKFMQNGLKKLGYSVTMVGSKDGGYTTSYSDMNTGESFTYDNENTGYSGYAIKAYPGRNGIYETLRETNCLTEKAPDIVILQIGTNNIIDNHDASGTAADLSTLLTYILDNIPESSELFVTGIPDLDPNRADVYDWFGNYRHSSDWQTQYDDATAEASIHKAVADYNAEVEAAVRRMQETHRNISPAYVQTAITDVKTQLFDGVHPNNAGYRAMGEYWTEYLAAFLSGTPADAPVTTTSSTSTTTTTTKTSTTISSSTTAPATETTTTASPAAEHRFNVTDIVRFSRYILGFKGLDYPADKMALYDLDGDGHLDTFDLVLLRKEVIWAGDKLREMFGEDYTFFEGGIDGTIINGDMGEAGTERVASSSSGSSSKYVAVSTELIDFDTDKELIGYLVSGGFDIYDSKGNVVSADSILYDENGTAYTVYPDGEKVPILPA